MAVRISGINSGLDTDSIVQELVSAYSKKTEKYQKEQTKLGWKQDAWKDLNKKVNAFYKKVGNLKYSSAYNTKKVTSSDTTKATVTATSGAVNGTQKLHVLSTAQSGYLTGGQVKTNLTNSIAKSDTTLGSLGFTDSSSIRLQTTDKDGKKIDKQITLNSNSKISDVVTQLRDAGVNASYDENNGRFYISSAQTGKDGDFTLSDNGSAESKKLLGILGLDTTGTNGNKATKLDGEDATIVLNGVEYTSSSNNFSINGLNIAVNGVTDNISRGADGKFDLTQLDSSKAVTLNVSTDVQGLYDKIKDFLTEYNNLINEITKLYNAESAKGYEPLTDDEKNEMSDREIEQWESKIKNSLLRRDDNLNTVMQSMLSAMSKTYTVNGKSYALSSFGIKTLGSLNAAENEQNAYHIDGDADDENTSGNKDALMAALTADPDSVVDFMKQLTSGLYDTLDSQMKSSTLRSKYSIYNDKEMDTQYKNYDKTIKDWEQKVKDKEDYYYKKFSAMETALGKINSQQSSLSGLFGTK